MRLRSSSFFFHACPLPWRPPCAKSEQVATISIPGTPINQFGSLERSIIQRDLAISPTRTDKALSCRHQDRTYVSRDRLLRRVAKAATPRPRNVHRVLSNGGARVSL